MMMTIDAGDFFNSIAINYLLIRLKFILYITIHTVVSMKIKFKQSVTTRILQY